MRIHRLELTAFGPFPATEVVDFDSLNDAGVFLLTGETGAGKTSILDAVCFGLFGQVPGARNDAKAFKSHHADPRTAPRVELDVTIRGRRFRLARQPAWQRPSSRARTGFVNEQARASIEERVDGQWKPLSNRVDEVGQLVSEVLGMNRRQFCQVVMLPQGDFQSFLRAGAKERHDILETLFETRHFQRVERWLVEHRGHCEAACTEQRSRVDTLIARVIEASQAPPDDLTDYDAWLRFTTEAVATGTTTLEAAARDVEAATTQAKTTAHAHDEARALAERQEAHREASRRLQALRGTAGVASDRARLIARAHDAAALMPLVDRCTETASRRARALHGVEAVGGASTPDDLGTQVSVAESQLEELREAAGSIRSLRAVQAEVDTLDHELARLAEEQSALDQATCQLRHEVSLMPEAVESLRSELAESTRVAAGADAQTAEATRTAQVLAAARRCVELRQLLEAARAARDEARATYLDARADLLDVRERYISGIAVELSSQLVAGEPCMVCGSISHPSPAEPTAGHVDSEAQAEAEGRAQQAELALEAVQVNVARLDSELSAADARCAGQSVDAAASAHDEASEAARLAAEASTRVDELTARLDESAAAHARDQKRLTEAETKRSVLDERHVTRQEIRAAKAAALESALGPDVRLEDREAELAHEVALQRTRVDALRALLQASADAADAADRLDAALDGSPFDGPDDVRAAHRTPADLANAEALNRTYEADMHAALQRVEDPVLAEAAALPQPDLDALRHDAETARLRETQQLTHHADVERRMRRMDELHDDLTAAVRALGPLVTARDLAVDVATMCAGTSADNLTKTRLSHYVLAARLEQVVEAGNLRLSTICGGRYQLRHSMTKGVGDTKGGLSLLVLDTYTGQDRDPATLSGGETFYVSLALALGLADLVTHEMGGSDLSTLFVDEGFGGLDADTLDEVMGELDSLRSGGRAVGLVSHLAELRLRIPHQLHVRRGRDGSRVAT